MNTECIFYYHMLSISKICSWSIRYHLMFYRYFYFQSNWICLISKIKEVHCLARANFCEWDFNLWKEGLQWQNWHGHQTWQEWTCSGSAGWCLETKTNFLDYEGWSSESSSILFRTNSDIKSSAQLAKCSVSCLELCKNWSLNLLWRNQKSDTVFPCRVSSCSSVWPWRLGVCWS